MWYKECTKTSKFLPSFDEHHSILLFWGDSISGVSVMVLSDRKRHSIHREREGERGREGWFGLSLAILDTPAH